MSFDVALRSLADSTSVFAIVTALDGSGKALVNADSRLVAGSLPIQVADIESDLADAMANERSCTIEIGGIEVFIEVVATPPRVVLVGAGHAAQALSRVARIAGFEVTVVDPRESLATESRFDAGVEVRCGWPDKVLSAVEFDDRTYVVFLAHDPRLEDEVLARAIRSDARYVGALGSRKTHTARVERLRAGGATDAQLARINSPIGLDIGSTGAEEMAVAIAAQLIESRRRRPN